MKKAKQIKWRNG